MRWTIPWWSQCQRAYDLAQTLADFMTLTGICGIGGWRAHGQAALKAAPTLGNLVLDHVGKVHASRHDQEVALVVLLHHETPM